MHKLKNKLYNFTQTIRFLGAERDLKAAKDKMLDLIDEYGKKENLTIREQNDMLERFIKDLKDNLFSGDKLHQKY